jgi:hypothetical protein
MELQCFLLDVQVVEVSANLIISWLWSNRQVNSGKNLRGLHLRKMGNKVRWWGGVNKWWLVRGCEYRVLAELAWLAQALGVTTIAW